MTDHLGLLVMRRLPAIGVTVLLVALTRKAMLRQPPDPAAIPLSEIAGRSIGSPPPTIMSRFTATDACSCGG